MNRRGSLTAPRFGLAPGAAVVMTLALAGQPASGAFLGATGNGGNSVSSAPSFCTTPGTTTVSASGDSWVDSAAVNANHGSDTRVYVRSSTSNDLRMLIRFTLPAPPSGCQLSSAVLRVNNRSPVSGRTIEAYRGDPAAPQWMASTVTWANQPAAVGTPVGSVTGASAGYQSWTVTAHVQAQYAGVNNGFVLKDSDETSTGTAEQVYDDLQHSTNPPRLVLTWS